MKRRLFFSVAFLVLVALAAGCGVQPTVEVPQEDLSAIEEKSAVVSEEEEATMTPEPTEAQVPPEAGAVVQLAMEDLADRLGVAPEDIQVVSVEAREWSDSSLGCPQPDMLYNQIITPGYQVVLEVDGQAYEYHTNTGANVVLCQPEGVGERLEVPRSAASAAQANVPVEAQAVVGLALEDLVGMLDVAPEDIQVLSVEAREWSDSSLGCPQPGMLYAQVITPGYQVVVEAGGQEYVYHTDTGNHVVLCEPEAAGEIPAAPRSVVPMPEVQIPPEAEQAVKLARQDLVSTQGLAPGSVRVVVVEPVDWSDASLGCPQPGMMYAQVITPGFLVVLDSDGQTYTYHTDSGRFAVLCEQGGGTSGDAGGGTLSGEAVTPDPNSPYYSLVIKAVEDLVGRLASAGEGQIDLLEVREVTWPDSSLGCPQPGMAYAQVPQEGLLIRLGVAGQVYEYHSGGTRDPFLCEQVIQVKPPQIKLDLTKTIPPPRDSGDQ